MDLKQLRELSDQWEAMEAAVETWYDDNIVPLVDDNTTKEELAEIWGQVTLACVDNENQFRDLPGNLFIKKMFQYNRLEFKGK